MAFCHMPKHVISYAWCFILYESHFSAVKEKYTYRTECWAVEPKLTDMDFHWLPTIILETMCMYTAVPGNNTQ
jgi:hypothetical protein